MTRGILTYIDIDYDRGPTPFMTVDINVAGTGPTRIRSDDPLRTMSFLAKNSILANNLNNSLKKEVDYTSLTKEYTYGRPRETWVKR